MGRYLKSFRIAGAPDAMRFLLPYSPATPAEKDGLDNSKTGTIHVLCGENSVGKSFILCKLESLWRGVNESGFSIDTVDVDDHLDGLHPLYYGKIWKQKDRCASFHFSNTKKKDVAPSDGPVSLFSSTLRFIYECAFENKPSEKYIDVDTFSDIACWKERLALIETIDIEAESKKCYPCPITHPLVKQYESIVEGYRLYYRFFYEKTEEICFEFVLVSPDGYVCTQSKWSDGQKAVFYLLINLYYQHSSLVILDEVENHMHPYYITKVLNVIKKCGRQCILSTHHPHVIFSEYVDRVFYIELEKNGDFPLEREMLSNIQTKRAFRRKITELSTDFEKITNTYKLFDNRDVQLLKLSQYYQNEAELKAYEIISRLSISNSPVSISKSSLPDKQTAMLGAKVRTNMRFLDIGAGYGRIKTELDKKGKNVSTWYLLNVDIAQHIKTEKLFRMDEYVHAINRYEDVEDGSVDAVIVSNVIHEITPPAFEAILFQAEKKLKQGGFLYIIDMEPLLYAEHYAVPYTYTEVEDLLNSNGWVCNHDISPHRFVTLYIVCAEKIGKCGKYKIDELWEKKRRNALAVYRTTWKESLADYQKATQAMATVCSIDSYFAGIWK